MIIKSQITKIEYDDNKCVFFRNHVQAAKYVSWGAVLIDVFVDPNDKFVFVFTKEDHNKFKFRWGKKDVVIFEKCEKRRQNF